MWRGVVSDAHDLIDKLLFGNVSFVAVPGPFVHLAFSQTEVSANLLDAFFREMLVVPPFSKKICLLLHSLAVVRAFLAL